MMAAKGLLSLYREVGAELLKKKDRGKDATMGIRAGDIQQLKYGEEEVATGIEGLELLAKWKEEQKKRKRAEREANGETKEGEEKDDDEDSFNESDWEVESVESDDSGGWINVDHSDDEDEKPAAKKARTDDSEAPELVDGDKENDKEEKEDPAAEAERLAKLATTTILTPADLAKLAELRMEANINKAMGNQNKHQKALAGRHTDDGLTAEQIELPSKLRKTTKEERLELARAGKPNRDEHKSTQAIKRSKKDAEGKSTTNKEKSRKKNFLMTIGKAKAKNKRSLTETRKVLKGHVERSKRGGRRGNIGQ
jgi:protein SDA1